MNASKVTQSARTSPRIEDEPLPSKRQQIIEQAIFMFNEAGYAGTRVGDITDSLNMGKGSFYLYFQNKKDLLLTCFAQVGELIAEIRALPEIRNGDFLSGIVPRVSTVYTHPWWSDLLNLLRAAESSADEEIRTNAREAQSALAANLRRDIETAIQSGHLRDVDPELATYGFMGLVDNLWYRSRFDSRYTKEEILQFIVGAVTRWLAIGSQPAEEIPPSLDASVLLVGRDGTEFALRNLRCDGATHLTGALGLGEIDIELSRLSQVIVSEPGETCSVSLTLTDGSEVQVRVAGSVVISGQNPLGTVRIALANVSSLKADEPAPADPS